ncbi:phosphoribosylformylglycinamidine synthase [Pundamilia nyererei]|uniref:Phosphoribosylformylglycinamidine synthase n=1 Tax=Pundamilia nyererei TaxID=303518 RepID=A0A9Y6JA74_9CICH|nr:PREDICTED: phosphoribosylformylglycinamidine synthase [Pundamilia nyererei]
MAVVRFYSNEALKNRALQRAAKLYPHLLVTTELCYNVELTGCESLSHEQKGVLLWLFRHPLHAEPLSEKPNLTEGSGEKLVEIGPRLNFSTAWSTNAVSICQSAGLTNVTRVELSRRFLIKPKTEQSVSEISGDVKKLIECLYDSMTECIYQHPITSFTVETEPQAVFDVDILGKGRAALESANDELGLAFDSWDLDYYTSMFQRIERNPTSVECFDLAQSNSEHSRHWFFRGRMVIDGKEQKETLFSLIMDTQRHSNQNNVIKFCDNSSGIKGMELEFIYPKDPSQASPYETRRSLRHVIFTAETHNFPTGVSPFSGATTGTGGRIRDVQSAGRGGHVIAGTAGYCFGNLHIPGYDLPWECKGEGWEYPSTFAPPLQVAIEASDGASDYGNKFGEPVLSGFARSFGMRLANGERREWIKPIMFSGGLGSIEDLHVKKEVPEPGMEVVKIGGPVYRIGVGGGAASSVQVQGDNSSDRDLGAVQRGDAEMEQKMNRALRACLERSGGNPICSIHDQGAGGNGNVLKELSEPAGAVIYCSRFKKGDPTLSVLELWGAEYQESNALLLQPSDRSFLERVCQREKCPVDFVGNITGDGKIVLVRDEGGSGDEADSGRCPVDLQLEWVLGKMPQKEFKMESLALNHQTLSLPAGLTVKDALHRVLRLPAVASKRYLTNKVDRSVTGLVAQQQCVGPLHTPLADVAVVALSPFSLGGAATAIGEQPIKGLVCPAAGARMAVGEALTNLVFARVTELKDVKCSGNWMWAAKLPGEGACLQEEEGLSKRTQPYFKLTFNPSEMPTISQPARVAVVREEGSNGDREMSVSLYMAGFEVWDVTMQDLCTGSVTLDPFKAVVFVGGFSYADVLGSAKGWAATVAYNSKAKAEFDCFRQREDTVSLGVCNGCQLLALLGWVGESEEGVESEVVLSHNKSGRFESRFVSVGIQNSPSIWLRGMEGSALGVWVAHGEGLVQFRSSRAQDLIISGGLAPLRYLDDQGHPTEEYPLNPNGSPQGIAGLCSRDGRHLAMMPHPERCTLSWQWPWAPRDFRPSLTPSPWLRMFKNAASWCSNQE